MLIFVCRYITKRLMSVPEMVSFFPSNLNGSLDFVSGNIETLGKKQNYFPREHTLSVYCTLI